MISDENSNQTFTKRVLIICALVTLIVLVVLAAIYVFGMILLLFGAILLAIFLHGLANVARRYGRISEGKSVLLTALSILIGAAGLILATPLLAVAMVLIQTIYIQDILGDKPDNLPGEDARKRTLKKAICRSVRAPKFLN